MIARGNGSRQTCSRAVWRGPLAAHLQAEHFARFAFDKYFKGPAAYFAVGGESLGGNAGINYDIKALPAKGALDGFRDFHCQY